ncbi:hypothetical protein Fmac_010643 [Flemingia macrophylla]|uniref:Uncharacterized protein n=1 Tax=Flemingia macrophylla TaxID=520843 RepID=A0ABD1MKX0_9FABA
MARGCLFYHRVTNPPSPLPLLTVARKPYLKFSLKENRPWTEARQGECRQRQLRNPRRLLPDLNYPPPPDSSDDEKQSLLAAEENEVVWIGDEDSTNGAESRKCKMTGESESESGSSLTGSEGIGRRFANGYRERTRLTFVLSNSRSNVKVLGPAHQPAKKRRAKFYYVARLSPPRQPIGPMDRLACQLANQLNPNVI